MKTHYFLIAVMIQFTAITNAQDTCTVRLGQVECFIEDTSMLFAQSRDHVPLDEAQLKTYLYNLWCSAIPNTITDYTYTCNEEDKDTTLDLTFEKKRLTGKDAYMFNLFVNTLFGEEPVPDQLPFSYDSEARSYFIGQNDIDQAFRNEYVAIEERREELINDTLVDTVMVGVRVYVAAKDISPGNEIAMKSHVYVVPQLQYTLKDSPNVIHYRDVYFVENEEKHVFDLTTPCPNACGVNNSVLNWPQCEE